MLQRCLTLRKALDATMMSELTLRSLVLSEWDWKVVADMVELLTPFSKITERMSKQYEPLMSLTAASYIDLYNHLESFNGKTEFHPNILAAAKLACEKLNEYYPKSDGFVYLAGIVLDPRCKLEWHRSVGFKSLVQGYKTTITKYWQKFYKPVQEMGAEEPATADIFERQMKRAKYDCKDELEKYLSLPPIKSSDLPNGVLTWWKEHSSILCIFSARGTPIRAVEPTGGVEEEGQISAHLENNRDWKILCQKKSDNFEEIVAAVSADGDTFSDQRSDEWLAKQMAELQVKRSGSIRQTNPFAGRVSESSPSTTHSYKLNNRGQLANKSFCWALPHRHPRTEADELFYKKHYNEPHSQRNPSRSDQHAEQHLFKNVSKN
ncbi:unnamed protein product [Allacma fusca]|uniref:Uncharacterized protein n=1 Tax=Allacma fusca TaxID=39272 RepID=A0A8J2JER8_9HEXA|nr:unnamed protein product [Allacma fusca]